VAGLGGRLQALGFDVTDLGNVHVAQAESVGDSGPDDAKFLPQIAASCERLGELVGQALSLGKIPLVLGGDHSIAVGSVAGVSRFFRESNAKVGLIWVDAHADMNTPQSSPSGNVHGMPLACCVGVGPKALTHMFGFCPKVDAANVALVGIRDVDMLERGTVRGAGVRAFTMRGSDRHSQERNLRLSSVARYGFCGSAICAGCGNSCARRRHLSGSAPCDGTCVRFEPDGFDGGRRSEPGDR
jgi:arginase